MWHLGGRPLSMAGKCSQGSNVLLLATWHEGRIHGQRARRCDLMSLGRYLAAPASECRTVIDRSTTSDSLYDSACYLLDFCWQP